MRYPWPHDVQELDESIRHAMRVCGDAVIAKKHLPIAIRSYRPDAITTDDGSVLDLDATLRGIEKKLIEQAVEAADGNRAEAARRLGISRARLIRRLDDHSERGSGT
ncbi:MAG: helix-turn-helix domain-containing protein [Planctomycetota bacterium]